jgi:hypothetical protein
MQSGRPEFRLSFHPDGSIIDGRNRYRACKKAGVAPRFQKWDGEGSLTDFVVAQNIDRRHLDATSRTLLAEQGSVLFQHLGFGRLKDTIQTAEHG